VERPLYFAFVLPCVFPNRQGAPLIAQFAMGGKRNLSRPEGDSITRYTHSPFRISGSEVPSAATPSTSISPEPIIQST